MEVHSSIFSSEKTMPTKGFPFALVIAILLILGLEGFLNFQNSETLLQYGTGLGAYYEIRHTIEDKGNSDICVLGSSRGRESLVMPLLRSMVSKKLGEEISVANFSCPDGKTDELLMVTDLMLESGPFPRLVLYFISPRIFMGPELSVLRREVFGEFPNQYGASNKHILAAYSEKPLWDLRNQISNNYLSFRHRYHIRNFFVSNIRGRKPTSPVQGEYSTWQMYTPNRSLVNKPVSSSHIKTFVQRIFDENTTSFYNPDRIIAFRENLLSLQDSGIGVILIEAPLAPPLLQEIPTQAFNEFDQIIKSITMETQVPYFSQKDLGTRLGLMDFREQSHLNLAGATKVTTALANQVIVPHFN